MNLLKPHHNSHDVRIKDTRVRFYVSYFILSSQQCYCTFNKFSFNHVGAMPHWAPMVCHKGIMLPIFNLSLSYKGNHIGKTKKLSLSILWRAFEFYLDLEIPHFSTGNWFPQSNFWNSQKLYQCQFPAPPSFPITYLSKSSLWKVAGKSSHVYTEFQWTEKV